MHNAQLEPISGWVFKTQTCPIYLAGQVLPNLLGLGWVPTGQTIFAITTSNMPTVRSDCHV